MGRKIPAKKHRGVKDPLEQQAKRLQILKTKINAPPKDPDEQPVPRTLTELFAFQNKDKTIQKTKRKHHVKVENNAGGVGHNPVNKLKKLPGESGRGFSLRINSAIRALNNPAEDNDYPADLEVEDYKGERMAAQRERRAKKRKRAGGARGEEGEERLTRTQKLALKKKNKKMKIEQMALERKEVEYERVSFGDVAHAPPALPYNKKLLNTDAPHRPGRRELLLTKLLTGSNNDNTNNNNNTNNKSKKPQLPIAERLRRERARLQAVDAYRALKTKKLIKETT